jgi:hypothetical protein
MTATQKAARRPYLRSIVITTAIAVVAMVNGSRGQSRGAAGAVVFVPAEQVVVQPARAELGERQRNMVSVDFRPLGGFYGAGTAESRLVLDLPNRPTMFAVLDRLDETASGRSWIGHLEDVPMSSVLLTVVRGAVAGSITWPGGNEFTISPAPNGLHAITELDVTVPLQEPALPQFASRAQVSAAAVIDANPDIIDLLAIYSPAVRELVGSEAGVAATIDSGVSMVNAILNNSGVAGRIRLSRMVELPMAVPNTCSEALDRLTSTRDGILDEVHQLRDEAGADLVFGFFTPSRDCSGVAWLYNNDPASGFGLSVMTRTSAGPIAHEIGHSLGAVHDWYVDDSRSSAKGLVNCAAGWKDIMSYTNECIARGLSVSNISYYSNPSLTYEGQRLGVPAGTGQSCRAGSLSNPPCDADASREIAANVRAVARYRASKFAVTSFPPRNEALDFRAQLEQKYRDGLRRSAIGTSADPEGAVVWTVEYLRYRLGRCSHDVAVDKVRRQISGQGFPDVCGGESLGAVAFPPRDQVYAFRLELERLYRDELRRTPTSTSVDPEGDVVWIQEYLRYRLNGCNHQNGVSRVMTQVDGGGIQPTCVP